MKENNFAACAPFNDVVRVLAGNYHAPAWHGARYQTDHAPSPCWVECLIGWGFENSLRHSSSERSGR